MKKITCLIALLLAYNFNFGQTTLAAGDIVVTGFNSDNNLTPPNMGEHFSFVLLVDVEASTVVKFTDKAWLSTNTFRTGEGILTWTADTYIPCGTEIIVDNSTSLSASSGTIVSTFGTFALNATNGDQILIYQGTEASPTFINAIHFGNTNGWSTISNSNNTSLPTGLTDGTNAVNFGDFENGDYGCSVTSGNSAILSATTNVSNWTLTDSPLSSIGGCAYTCDPCFTTATWDGTSWNIAPTIDRKAVIDDDYDTSTNGNFTACSLDINNGAILNVADNTYVEVENNVDVDDGEITVQNHGAFVQNNDSATFTLGVSGYATVRKETSTLTNWYDYTYWGSPVTNTTAGSAFFTSDMRFWFNANNYIDALQESGNDNTLIAGSDDIDDDGNDWQTLAPGTTLAPGVGYAATHTTVGFTSGASYNYNFEGAFNNGLVTSTIYYNPANIGEHWNLIGNPYPCALDFDAFYALNSGVVSGAAYLWSHSTPASSAANGNQGFNFSQNDYIIINTGSGSVNNTPGTVDDFIPSGQGFFIAGIANGSVSFNNSMRVADGTSNSQFFKNSKKTKTTQTDKLWINLTSNNGIFNQILIAYVKGATNNYDGMAYDAPRNLSSGVASIIYTKINGENDKKYAIQGKSPDSITINEIIPIGFYTSITAPTIYTLSVEKSQGDFLTKNFVYLNDNLLNKSHNLSNGNYTFTSETGEFNDRFEIVFNEHALLSTDDFASNPSNLTIVELENNNVNFSTTHSTLKSIAIFDLLGRELYNLKGNSNSETYTLSHLKSAVYIAKVTLANGAVITKKAVKK
ncbi:T9SS sorting signal type C domain-containing protein [Algibacter sp. 2305UL17-15]|uniref:T9SS sorting signal type C domain-containing protein n=1 Tax=Algibacter sp. 2305UL17-15 TaxID=3231268 RepID=UPI00345A3479